MRGRVGVQEDRRRWSVAAALIAALLLPLSAAHAGKTRRPSGGSECNTRGRTSSGSVTCVTLTNDTSQDIVLSGSWENYSCKQQKLLGGTQPCSGAFDVNDEYAYANNGSNVVIGPGESRPLMWIDDAQDADWWYTVKWKRQVRIGDTSHDLKVQTRVEAGVTYKSFALDDRGWTGDAVIYDGAWPGVALAIGRPGGDIAFTAIEPRPFYLIAHRTNSAALAREAVERGANAVEIDVRYDDGRVCAQHDTTTEKCEDFCALLDELRNVAGEQPHFALLLLDFKDSDGEPNAGSRLLETVRERLTRHVDVKVILAVAELDEVERFGNAAGDLRSGEALAIDYENQPRQVEAFFQASNARNYAFGNGVFVAGIAPNVEPSIREAVGMESFGLVYVWTLANKGSMREYIEMGVDGILVNSPGGVQDLWEVMKSSRRVRLAPRSHNPFP